MVAAMNFDNLVAVLAVAAAVPLILAAVPRVRVPGPVLEIVAGIVLGPAVLDLVKPDQAVRLVSTIGLAFLLFLAGLEIDVRHFRGPRARLAGLPLAGAILRLVDAGAEHKHPLFHPKLDAIGYGFLIPVFFVTSGLTFNLSVLFSSAPTLLRVPLFLLALLVVRGLPAVLYRSALASVRDVAAAGLFQATSLPFIVAATIIGLQVHAIGPANAAALVAAGLSRPPERRA
jgi:Kef-type K+ transport system membrane component KefB